MSIVMLVDDDRDDRTFFGETLKSVNPYAVFIECKSGRDAFDLLATEKNLPDVIFLDINMPDMSGWEVLTTLKRNKELNHIPVIMYSTSSNERDVRIAEDFGAIGFCTKPEDVKQLQSMLKFITENHRALSNELLRASGQCCSRSAGVHS